MKILVVDDIVIVVHYLQRLLTQHGHTVLTAKSGEQGLHLLERDALIDLVITDLIMPGMNGNELFKASQKIKRMTDSGLTTNAKFILVTAARPTSTSPKRELALLQEAAKLDFVDVMFKPIDMDRLVENIKRVSKNLTDGHRETGKTEPIVHSADEEIGSGYEKLSEQQKVMGCHLLQLDQKQKAMQLHLNRLDEKHETLMSKLNSLQKSGERTEVE